MAVTDLTGTTWVLNSTAAEIGGFNYSVNVLFDGTLYSYFVGRYDGGNDCFVYGVANSAGVIPIHILSQIGGSTSIVETGSIEFLGGTDATNTNLIAWLEANATQILDPPISQFQNCQLCIKQPLGAYTLTWDSGITVTVSGNSVSQGYELQDGDIIQATIEATTNTVYAVINSITYNAPADISLYDTNIHISYYIQGSGGSVN